MVPDIAVDGSPTTGFKILTTYTKSPCNVPIFCPNTLPTSTAVVAGTSLSSPLAAALFTNMLATQGVTSGVGDIHGALYSAYAAGKGVFRDVTSGRNGLQSDVDGRAANGNAAELPVKAQKGFDTVTGLGAPLWPLLGTVHLLAEGADRTCAARPVRAAHQAPQRRKGELAPRPFWKVRARR